MTNFKVGFFELMLLAERCIPPSSPNEQVFWDRLIDKFYFEMTERQRVHAYEWLSGKERFDIKNEKCSWFAARYNPDNQFIVKMFNNGKQVEREAFFKDKYYWITRNAFISPNIIVSAKKK